MAGNGIPIYSRVGDLQWIEAILTANTTRDLTTGTIYLVFTADATNGGRVERVRFTSKGTNAGTVARVWINNGSATGTAANNWLHAEVTLDGTTANEVTRLPEVELTMGYALPPGYRIYVTIGTAATAGWVAGAIAGKY
jgi:hypothetical protein